MSKATKVGATKIEVSSLAGLKIGMKIVLGNGATAEFVTIKGFGSLIFTASIIFPHGRNFRITIQEGEKNPPDLRPDVPETGNASDEDHLADEDDIEDVIYIEDTTKTQTSKARVVRCPVKWP